jgi:carbon monoxide dehydrogenase subunit G
MKFENEFTVDAPIDEVYDALLDVERVAPCVPGAQVLEQTGDDAYKVSIKVKVGPIQMLYNGTVEIIEKDPENHRAVMRAKAKESRGQGTADARVEIRLTEESGKAKGELTADVQLAGKAASMGRGVIQDVSARLVDTFAQNLAAMLAGPPAAAEAEAAPVEPEAAAAAGPATPTAEQPVREAPAWTPPADQEALDVGGALGPVIAQRLRDPKVLAALGVVALLLVLLGRRR